MIMRGTSIVCGTASEFTIRRALRGIQLPTLFYHSLPPHTQTPPTPRPLPPHTHPTLDNRVRFSMWRYNSESFLKSLPKVRHDIDLLCFLPTNTNTVRSLCRHCVSVGTRAARKVRPLPALHSKLAKPAVGTRLRY